MIPLTPKKIQITIPCLLHGGTEVQSLQLAKVLISRGDFVSVLCYHEYSPEVVKDYEDAGCRVELANYLRSISKLQILINLVKWFRRENPDVVHVQYIAPAATVILAARLAGIRKVMATVHQVGTDYGLKEHFYMSVSTWLCSKMIFVSLAAQQSWTGSRHLYSPDIPGSYKSKTGVIYNCFDPEETELVIRDTDREELRQSAGLGQKFIIGAVSRLRHEKGIDVLLEAFPRVLQAVPDARLLIAGDGPSRAALHSLAERLNIAGHITWAGEQSHYVSLQFIKLMDVVVIPSRREGFGLTAIEAMALGKPVAASNTGGLAEIIRNGENGLLFPAGDAVALSDAILALHENPEFRNRLTAHAMESVRESFSREKFRKSIDAAYNSLFTKNH